MIQIRNALERGHAQQGWLESYHSFSFAGYQDPQYMGFRNLRVINEDRVQPGKGFAPHSHKDMEIISYVLEGELEHHDSMGNGSVIRPGDIQLMRAGSGVTHSEYNPSRTNLVHFLQIWIIPRQTGLQPDYQQRNYPVEARQNRLLLIASPDGHDKSLKLSQDALIYASVLDPSQSVTYTLTNGRHAWIQLAKGRIQLNGLSLAAGDGAALSDEAQLRIVAGDYKAEFIVFDLA
jgi:quercetin 2,3-dioxygenase